MTKTNTPLDKIRCGRVSVTIWENQTAEGKAFHSFTLQRTYTDARGKPQSTSSFSRDDLLALSEALWKAFSTSLTLNAKPAAVEPKKAKPKMK